MPEQCEMGEHQNAGGQWSITDVRPREGFGGVLAWEGGWRHLEQWELNPD